MRQGSEVSGRDRPERKEASLHALASYLERALDKAVSVIMMRHAANVCTVYLGDPSGPREELRRLATIDASLEDEMLRLTSSGLNRLEIGGQPYRFVRSFTQIEGTAAVVFSA
ncbi:conserved hypothetical protein [Burkholderia sp. 8Y]|uniref:hypothetical protein n=1 Tax=Burkholderia sp. 8Y TaxID=2653133 RepID=UPI0012F38D41|nr:hypothetical protein [Burkholderia sp. 8Y]VXC65987.1 conserved hypothetical protein [Burkholderia sp. 8Y]